MDRLDELAELKPGWAGEGTPAIDPSTIEHAREVLKHLKTEEQPFISPSADGAVCLEWEEADLELEIDGLDSSLLFFGKRSAKEVADAVDGVLSRRADE